MNEEILSKKNIIQNKPLIIFLSIKFILIIWQLICFLFSFQTFGWFLTILISYLDFWSSKTIFGKSLANLYYYFKDSIDGDLNLEFVSNLNEENSNKIYFKYGIFITPFFWGCCLLISLFKFSFGWLFTYFFAISISLFNLWGFHNCNNNIKSNSELNIEHE